MMCGLVGVYHFDRARPIDEHLLVAQTDTLVHRGPDGGGVWSAPGIGLGHRRLSIIDIGGNFSIGGTTVGGAFDDALGTLLGVDISPWGLAAPADGHFAITGLDPDGQGFDPNADVDVFVLTPAPAGLSALAMGLLLASRRRR